MPFPKFSRPLPLTIGLEDEDSLPAVALRDSGPTMTAARLSSPKSCRAVGWAKAGGRSAEAKRRTAGLPDLQRSRAPRHSSEPSASEPIKTYSL